MANEKQEKKTPEIDVDAMVDNHVQKALKALEQFMDMTQEQVDKIVEAMTVAGQENHTRLAKMAVEETGRGVYEDKIIKNMFATEYIWHSIKNEKTVGIVEENELEGYVEIAEPVGVVAAATPVTNPTSTTMFKSLICMKSRNPVIFGFHPSAQQCSVEAAKVLYDAAVKAGAPENCIQWIETPSIQACPLFLPPAARAWCAALTARASPPLASAPATCRAISKKARSLSVPALT